MPTPPVSATPVRVLLFESRIEGHHLPWLKMIAEDLLSGGVSVSLAVRQDAEARRCLAVELGDLLSRVPVLSITDEPAGLGAGRQLQRAGELRVESGAETVFFCCLDEVASACLRRAAIGWLPPRALRGRFGGIFLRPRFLKPGRWSLNDAVKGVGFRRLLRNRCLGPVLFTDEWLCERALQQVPGAPVFPLADPPTQEFRMPPFTARAALGLATDRRVFLFYGGPYRRKGLHLAVQAFLALPADAPAFLLCLGSQPQDPETARGLCALAERGQALALNRRVSAEEEQAAFCAADIVLLPYLQHFGSSGVMAQAATAGKPMIASDEELVGRRVRDFGMGWLFRSGDAPELREVIEQVARLKQNELQVFVRSVGDYARRFSRAGFRATLLSALGVGPAVVPPASP
jgi:glycosyltransferase involved in cell wall biosynthesis